MQYSKSRRPAWLMIAALLASLASPALADYNTDDDKGVRPKAKIIDGRQLQEGYGIEVGAIIAEGHSEFASNNLDLSPSVRGLVIRDRNGMSSRMVIGLALAIASALAQSGPKSVSSTTETVGDYRVTTTTTTYYSEAEKAEMRESSSDAIGGLFAAKFADFELYLFSRDRFKQGDASGYKANLYIGDIAKWGIGFETGFGFGKVNSLVESDGMPVRIHYKYFGMPFRFSGVIGPLRAAFIYEWNLLKYGIENSERQIRTEMDGSLATTTASHPWKLDLSAIIAKRFSVMGGVTTQLISQPKPGFYASVGFVF